MLNLGTHMVKKIVALGSQKVSPRKANILTPKSLTIVQRRLVGLSF